MGGITSLLAFYCLVAQPENTCEPGGNTFTKFARAIMEQSGSLVNTAGGNHNDLARQ
jgi:hypothetical protein